MTRPEEVTSRVVLRTFGLRGVTVECPQAASSFLQSLGPGPWDVPAACALILYTVSLHPDGNDVFNFRCSRGEGARVSRCHYETAASSPLLCQSYDSLERLCCACVCLAEIPLALLELWTRD